MATVEIDLIESNNTFVIGGSGIITHSTSAPSGGKVLGGGFKVENLDTPGLSMSQVIQNGPNATEDAWVVSVQPNAQSGEDVRLTVYATYVKVN